MNKTKVSKKVKKGQEAAFEYRTHFDSFSEFLAVAADEKAQGTSKKTGGSHETWTGTRDFAHAMQLATEGWPDGLKMIEEMSAQLAAASNSELFLKPYIAWEVAGDFADAGLFAAGVPECMGAFHEEIAEQTGKVVSILMNITASGGVSAKEMMARGACVLALVDALENAGKSCEIHVCEAVGESYSSGSRYGFTVPVKEAGEHLELDRLAFVLAHPSMLRRMAFAVEEMESEEIRRKFRFASGGTYGYPAHLDKKSEAGRYNLVVPEMSLVQWQNGAEALRWVKQQLANQGLTVEGFTKLPDDDGRDEGGEE